MQLFKLLVGRQQRTVHALDVVPALPPLDNYASVDYGRWIPENNTVVLEVSRQNCVKLSTTFPSQPVTRHGPAVGEQLVDTMQSHPCHRLVYRVSH